MCLSVFNILVGDVNVDKRYGCHVGFTEKWMNVSFYLSPLFAGIKAREFDRFLGNVIYEFSFTCFYKQQNLLLLVRVCQ